MVKGVGCEVIQAKQRRGHGAGTGRSPTKNKRKMIFSFAMPGMNGTEPHSGFALADPPSRGRRSSATASGAGPATPRGRGWRHVAWISSQTLSVGERLYQCLLDHLGWDSKTPHPPARRSPFATGIAVWSLPEICVPGYVAAECAQHHGRSRRGSRIAPTRGRLPTTRRTYPAVCQLMTWTRIMLLLSGVSTSIDTPFTWQPQS